ncbi:plasmid mobilization protein [Desulfonatronum thioautotrophicum]|uniref:plasmid mobilization protein n=1 Tax=Desulfonatronum thioautotrophicum TaxID=617001 RepID=UPI0005EBDBA6|nr:hypothetical protein [Desulfonatronum thioautotrophicum]
MNKTKKYDDDNKENLRHNVNFRLTLSEKRQLEINAREAGVSLSKFIRKRVLGSQVAKNTDILILAELSQLVSLLKKFYVEGTPSASTIEVVIKDLQLTAKEIVESAKRKKNYDF